MAKKTGPDVSGILAGLNTIAFLVDSIRKQLSGSVEQNVYEKRRQNHRRLPDKDDSETPKQKPGQRRPMTEKEKKAISKRMRKTWAARKAGTWMGPRDGRDHRKTRAAETAPETTNKESAE